MSHKRKSDHDHAYSTKKPRFENGHSHHNELQSNQQQPQIQLPPLPLIDPKWEAMVFTHPSMASQEFQTGIMQSYDRLEFLGDAYLEIIATRLIWESYKDLSTGKMSQIRESLVRNETLGEFAVMYGLDKRLKAAPGCHPQKAQSRAKINGDIFEAFIAAVILSDPVKGFEVAEDWVTQLWASKLKHVIFTSTDLRSKEELAKSILYKGVVLDYIDERPPVIQKGKGVETYFIGVYVTGWGYENQHLGSGTGLSKKAAGMEAALKALQNKPLIDQIAAKKSQAIAKKREEELQKTTEEQRPVAPEDAPT